MKKTGMFLAVILVASLFASSFALAESFSLTGKAIGLDSNTASVSATELVPSLSSSDIEESISNVDSAIGKKPAFPGITTVGNGWIVTDDKRTAFVNSVWTERKTSEGLTVSFGKLRVGKNTYKLEKVGEWNGKSLKFSISGPKGVKGKLSLDLTERIGQMKFWEGTFSFDETIGDLTLATKAHKIRKPTIDSGNNELVRKPIDVTTESEDDSKVSFDNEAPAKEKKKGFFGRIFSFFGKK